jgi:hypothetical protein
MSEEQNPICRKRLENEKDLAGKRREGGSLLSEARVARVARMQKDAVSGDGYRFEFNSQSFPACSRFISHLSEEQHPAPICIQMKAGNGAVETERGR